MTERSFPATFMRGGTSKALMFRTEDLPDRSDWDAVFVGAMGSPDPFLRQMNGMGGGISSLSKVCVMGRSKRPDADVDYTFAQVLIKEARVDYRGNCGNMSSAVGPFAIEAGLVDASGETATVRIFNTNTSKIIEAVFPLLDGKVRYEGDLEIPGVAGRGAPIKLRFLDPGGASTGKLLPSGSVTDRLSTEAGEFEASLVDAANACVFVRAADVGLTGGEAPTALDHDVRALETLAAIRRQGSVVMGIAPTLEAAAAVSTVPYVAFVSPPTDYQSADGENVSADAYDLAIRVISNGQPHRACPLTIALCTAVAARIEGTIPAQQLMHTTVSDKPIRIGTPAGVLTVGADVGLGSDGQWQARSGDFFRTARKLFEGRVWSQI